MDFQKELDGLSLLIDEIENDVGGFLQDKTEDLNTQEIETLIKKFEFYIEKMNEKVGGFAQSLNLSKEQLDDLSNDPENLNLQELEPLIEMQKKIEEFKKSLTKNLFDHQNQLIIKKEQDSKKQHTLKTSKKNWIPS
jgi:hypothetical protein